MKSTNIVFTTVIVLILISCREPQNTKRPPDNKVAPAKPKTSQAEEQRLAVRRLMDEEERLDSLRNEAVLADALKIAEKYHPNQEFKEKLTVLVPDSSYAVETEIMKGFFFSSRSHHLIIRRRSPGALYIDVYVGASNHYEKVLSEHQNLLEYTTDTIRDINGDGLKDLVVNRYGSAGCCLKAFTFINLLMPDSKSFSNKFDFINPTFSPKEQMIRGICYGQPGETEMYKYKWNKAGVDTIEYVSFEKDDLGKKTGKVIISTTYPLEDNNKILKRLNHVPPEYRQIYGYEWFTGNW